MKKEATYQDWKDEMAQTINARLKEMRFTWFDLAYWAGLPDGYVRRVAEAKLYPAHKARLKMADVLGVDLEAVSPRV